MGLASIGNGSCAGATSLAALTNLIKCSRSSYVNVATPAANSGAAGVDDFGQLISAETGWLQSLNPDFVKTRWRNITVVAGVKF
jgi:cobalamin biosynthesis protein CbiD